VCSFGLAASSACYTFDPQDKGPQATSTSSDEDPQAISTSSARGRHASTAFDTTHDERRLLRQAQREDNLFSRYNTKTATSSSAQREDGRNSFGSPSAGFDPSSAHSARQLLGFSTQGRSHGLRLFYRMIVTGHLRPMCPLRRWPSASGLRHAVMAATGWFPPEGMLRHSALGGLRQPMPSARDARSRLRPAATTARRQPSSARTSSARG